MKQFFAILLVTTIVVATPALASAGEQEALKFLAELVAIPDQPGVDSAAQNALMKERAARVMIINYAISLSWGFRSLRCPSPPKASPQMIAAALEELNKYLPVFAEQKLGGKDKLAALRKTNPGLRALAEMSATYQVYHGSPPLPVSQDCS